MSKVEVKLDPLWVKMATKFVIESELKLVASPPIPKNDKKIENLPPNGFII